MTMFSFVAPLARETAEELSKSLGNRTIQSGSISTGKGNSTSIQMIGRPLMTPDEIINMQIGTFVLMKAGKLPVKVKLNIFSNYLPKRELYIERAESSIMQEIPYLTSDKIKSYVTRKQSTLSKGMFD